MSRIPREFIHQVLERIEIVELIDTRIPLKKKSGNNYFACCPFHTEKSASFSVSQNKQFFHCFGCGAHGNAIDFIMQFERLEFREAIEVLAKQVGLDIPHSSTPDKPAAQSSLYELLEKVSTYYQNQLRQQDRAKSYLKNRGLSGQVAKDFSIGYAPSGWEHVTSTFGTNPTLKKQLFDTGMLIKKEDGGYYDRFRDRIMFPIQDRRGRTIGFGGRIIDQGEPKYLNSPETPLFQKGHELYGLHQALQIHRQLPRALIVEGYMDVIGLFQHGITYAMATLGTATTTHHLERLFRYTSHIIFCFDGDTAGRTAAWRALTVTLPIMRDGIQIHFMFLPEGEDPDSMVRKEGKDNFEKRIQNAVSIADFFFQNMTMQTNLESPDGRARFIKLSLEHLDQLPDGFFKQLMLDELAKKTRTTVKQLQPQTKPSSFEKNSVIKNAKAPSPLRMALALLTQQPTLVNEITEALPTLEMKGYDFLVQLVDFLKNHPALNGGMLFEAWRDKPESDLIKKLQSITLLTPEKGFKNEFLDAIKHLKMTSIKQAIEKLLSRAANQGLSQEEKEQLNELIQKQQAY